MSVPVKFSQRYKQAANPAVGGYPYQLSASDLDANFEYAAAEFDPDDFTQTQSDNKRTIKLTQKIPTPPTNGTHVFGVKDGTLQWIATEEC